ncbi:glutamine-hydrolyzing GMP synthase [uncultured Paludibaculum sp.]|uniref:glutamine-hydrolyzing GMP synthase n=1 Tax=uncultured Paludibaculum sp. TaxID=1765020 RepID=UPI002AAB781B|nr:glutamine-hydrolyzing GMP synthase [uncultured Paludibaculum sp.]
MNQSPDQGTQPQIIVLDTGGQYCHLITRKIRELGIYSEIRPSETPASELAGVLGIVISGGPASVYETGSPQVDPAIFDLPCAVLGICYGQQLIAWHLGGTVSPGKKGEYGMAHLDLESDAALFRGATGHQQVWMSHRDTVTAAPAGFEVYGATETCAIASMGSTQRRIYGVQFHPEVVHTERGRQILSNFLFGVCGCQPDWSPREQTSRIEEEIRQRVGDRNVFFFVSGGVDSTVAFTLCLRALGQERVRALYVDTGLMRESETPFVQGVFESLGRGVFAVEQAQDRFLGALAGVREPEKKRHIIGEKFVEVQEQILASGQFLEGNWILGQGTIYPDTIESGGTTKADLIKTHHNRVSGIQKLLAEGRIVEPLHLLYKDEVREVGRELDLPEELLSRHPFPGPGLAIRCLCEDEVRPVEPLDEGWLAPLHSVGVQGDSRTYRPVLLLEESPANPGIHAKATELINRLAGINRVAAVTGSHTPVAELKASAAYITAERLDRLRAADSIVRSLCLSSGFEHKVWQFPVIIVPLGTGDRPDSIVLRPIDSVDGMTAQSVAMPRALLDEMTTALLALPGICAVLYDLTHKPPGTIEWE